MSSRPLLGLGVLVTRPEAQAARTAQSLRDAGAAVFLLPALELAPVADAALEEALANIRKAHSVIFVSANAVAFGLAALQKNNILLAGVRIAAIGLATAAALAERGLAANIMAPTGNDSEALLMHPALQAVAGQPIILFRGQSDGGGRQLLADTLRERGAQVFYATCYRRSRPQRDAAAIEPVEAALAAGHITVIQVMSVETLENLLALLGEEAVAHAQACRLVVPHARIAARAREAEFAHVEVAGFGDLELIAALSQGRA